MQVQIERTINAFENVQDGYTGMDVAFREMKKLEALSGGDEVRLVSQLAYMMATASTEKQYLTPLMLFNLLEISEIARVTALAPYMEAEHRGLWGVAHDVLPAIDNAANWGPRAPLERVNYRVYRDYIATRLSRDEPVPEPFVRYIYRRLPGHALLAFVYAHEEPRLKGKDVLWAEHVVGDAIWRKENGFAKEFEGIRDQAIEQLDRLSRHDQWWVRLYVAEILDRHREFRTSAIVERLTTDPSRLVREVFNRQVQEAKTPASEAPTPPPPNVRIDPAPPPDRDEDIPELGEIDPR